MKKIVFLLLLVVLSIFCFNSNAKAFTAIKADSSGNVLIEGNENINDNVATAGNIVVIKGTIDDDLFVVGQNIKIEGNIKGTLFAAGNEVEITGNIGQDALVAGNMITLSDTSTVARDLFAAGNMVSISSPVGRNAYFAVANLAINSIISGNVMASFSDIKLNGGQILGKLTYSAEKSVNIDPALVTGGIDFKQIEVKKESTNQVLMSWLMKLLTSILIGIIIVLIMPKWANDVSEKINKNFLKSLGIGFLMLIVIPILSIIALITILGAPFGLILMVFYFILIYLAKFFVALCLGNYIGKNKINPYLSMILGLVILYLIFAIPVLGGVAGFVVLLVGIGGVYLIEPFKSAK